jgi:pimeloyl-ACP methyl ester carboxylesterase
MKVEGRVGAIEPYRIAVPDEDVEELQRRLRTARWADDGGVADWSRGVPLGYLREVCRYWADDYDWRGREAGLNRFDQLMVTVDGIGVHVVHARSPHPKALPLLLTHGWPCTFVEFVDVIGPLVDPVAHGGSAADAFHVVCPTLPGFGFSGKPGPGCGVEAQAIMWAGLMSALGYGRYGVQGGDAGSLVSTRLAADEPERVIGLHLNMVPLMMFRATAAVRRSRDAEHVATGADERRALEGAAHYERWDSSYAKQQFTRPQTLGYGLTDSPVGQAAWILQCFWAWTDCGGDPESALSRDQMLDEISVSWFTASAVSSARFYWELYTSPPTFPPVTVPTGIAVFPKEIVPPVRSWCEEGYTDIRHWTEMPRGGHFAATEQPSLFVDDLRAFFRPLR